MAYNIYRERHLRFTGTADLTMASLPVGTSVLVHGVRVLTAAGAGTMILTIGGVTAMASADIAPTATGIKRNTTPGPYLTVAAADVIADGTGITGTPEFIFYLSVAKIEPGAGEV